MINMTNAFLKGLVLGIVVTNILVISFTEPRIKKESCRDAFIAASSYASASFMLNYPSQTTLNLVDELKGLVDEYCGED